MRRYIGIVFLCVAVMVALLGCDRAEESAEKGVHRLFGGV